ncbi:MAG: ATP-binding protein [Gemmatimonadaceae bacterium]
MILTSVVLATTAYVLIERALLESAGRRIFGTAQVVAQLAGRPTPLVVDSANRSTDDALRAFLRDGSSRAKALAALSLVATARDTISFYAALLDARANPLLKVHRESTRDPKWPTAAILNREIRGDTASLGPFESGGIAPVISFVRPLRGPRSPKTAPPIGYVVESRAIASAGTSQRLRSVIGRDVEVLIGQPGAGVWTDFDRVAAAPPVRVRADSVVVFDSGVGAFARVVGTNWVVWLSQPKHVVLAPARTLLWTLLPVGLAIALVGAALMWRVTRRITHPIVELTMAAENIAADNGSVGMLPTVLIPSDADEVARLRHAFERMAQRVAERQTLELQLRHAQKMEAVGQLAGGVAHDFNNLLTAIRSYADLMLEDMPVWDTKRSDVLEIRSAAQRAAGLTAQLLAFSRKQLLQPRILDTGVVLTDVKGMLQRLLIEDIRLDVEVPGGLWRVKVDRGQLEQVIVNLAVNSRDAMPHGGVLHISAANEQVREPRETGHGTMPPGDYVAIRVTDSGVGMDEATQAHAFEPFFTTKPVGQGTGLGLSTVHGIVAQSGGYVTLVSAPERGTTFTLYLPRVLESPSAEVKPRPAVRPANSETILLVEDEQAVRVLARRVLTRSGFRVLESASPKDAIRLAEQHASEIKLVLTDVVMPEMSGPTLVTHITELCPTARVLFISGYTDNDVIGRGLSKPGMMLLQKPFSAQELVERVRMALDQQVEVV